MRFFVLLVTVFVINFNVNAFEIDCEFGDPGGHGYACDVQTSKLLSADDRELTSVTGTHQGGKNNNDVIVFWSNGKIKNFFPQNITKFFKNTQKILIVSANLSTISKYDLQPFGSQLKNFWFHYNNFEAIERDLFEYTPNLEVIQLSNQIKYVGGGAFSNLKKLTMLYFNSNPCHSGSAGDRSAVISLSATIESKCTDLQALERQRNLFTTTTTTTEVPTTTTTERNWAEELINAIKKLNDEHKKKIDELNAANDDQKAALKLENEKLKQENEKCSKIEDRIAQIIHKEMSDSLMQKIMEQLKSSDAKMEANFEAIDAKLDTTKSQIDSSKDTCSEHFTTLDYKIEVLNKDCVSKPFYRRP